MKEPHEKGIANQFGPESCAGLREETGEAFDRGKSRPAIELRNHHFVRADLVLSWGRPYGGGAHREPTDDATESKTLCMDGRSSRGNRETPAAPLPGAARVGWGRSLDRTPTMHAAGESDGLIVPRKQANKAGPTAAAESVEGRRPAKGNIRRVLLATDSEPCTRGIDLSDVRQANACPSSTRGKSRMR
jgi:RNA-directed DNA polymerase